jgi:hypothetical protein
MQIIRPPAPLTDTTLAELELKTIMDQWYSAVYKSHLKISAPHHIQVLEANQAIGSRAVLAAWSKRKEATLQDLEFLHAIRTRLGYGLPELLQLQQRDTPAPCRACLKPNARAVPEHLSSCPKILTQRHDEVVTSIREMILATGIQNVITEHDVGAGADKCIDLWFRDPNPKNPYQPYYMVDPTIIQAFPANTSDKPATKAELQAAYNKKFTTYGQIAVDKGATLIPLPFTTFGAYHGQFKRFTKAMAKIAVTNGAIDPRKEDHFAYYWSTNIIFSIARCTAQYAMRAAHMHNVAV